MNLQWMDNTQLVLRRPTHVILGISEHLVGDQEYASHLESGMDGLQYANKVMKNIELMVHEILSRHRTSLPR